MGSYILGSYIYMGSYWGPIYCIFIYIEQTLILNFIFGDCSLIYCIRKDSENVQKKYSFLMSLRFFENENFAARSEIRAIFWN